MDGPPGKSQGRRYRGFRKFALHESLPLFARLRSRRRLACRSILTALVRGRLTCLHACFAEWSAFDSSPEVGCGVVARCSHATSLEHCWPTRQIDLRRIRRIAARVPVPTRRIPAVARKSAHAQFPVDAKVSIPGLGWRSRGTTPVITRFTPPGGQTVASTAGNPSVRTRWKDVLDCFGRCGYPRRRRPLISCRREAFAPREQPMRVLK